MAKFYCVCGYIIRTSGEIPHPYQWSMVSDGDFDRLFDSADADEVYQVSPLMFRCPESGHLWVYWNGMDQSPSLYSPTAPDVAAS
ncbi:hypothetical protein ACFQHV_11505 [Promicromonospora thailandica]|uniref:Uncharacterized protein n=1 Tax=Promicromonospora thailandica TaxID=765201 RepID=A0A9X2G0W3_9MICO|nr:hypothetical protein [Promicromonospora thailandica]MCP2265012.1 hypothetical protein [Promicromonospora thailandica]BFF19937.1 hypothetical protein GCM10025730_34580 [Promicromonospora thailandica]